MNRLVKVTDTDGVVEAAFVYDRAGFLVKEMNAADYLSADTDEERTGTYYTYDYEGNVCSIRKTLRKEENGRVCYSLVTFGYDVMGRFFQKRYLDEQDRHSAKGRVNRISYAYDRGGRLCRVTDSTGAVSEYTYNSRGQRTVVRNKIREDVWQETGYTYSPCGNIIKVAVSADENGCGRKYAFTTYTYDGNGNITGIQLPSGDEIHREYDLCDRITAEHYREKNGGIDNRITYHYDKNGNLTEVRYQNDYTITMRYDYRYYEGGLLKEKRASGRILTSYTYDAEGNKVSQKDLTGKETGYRYDFSGRLMAVTDMGQCNPDRLHFADADASGRILAEYVYSASGNPVVKKIGGNITSTYGYDELLNIKALKTETEKQTLADNHYFYDGNGNQIRREGLEGTTGYAYDGRNRLTEISYPSALGGYTEKLGYDAAGNRIRRETEQEITTYRYDNCNRLQELRREYKNTETSTAQPQIIRYTYDRQGNMLSEGEKKYSYDSFGRMVRAEVPVEHRVVSNKPDEHTGFSNAAQSTGETFGIQENSSATREFQVQINRYDGEGLRHEMEENGRLIKFLYNEDREVVAEETGNGTITRYIRGLGIISSDSEEAKTYYHYVSDEQGSITHVLSEDAEILNHYSYDAFGNIIEKTEKVENRFCYNGEMLDPITQQYYLRARFYNPVIGRFTQEDTYYGDGLNLYQYCQANPVGYVDPSGHTCEIVQNHYKQYQEYRKQHPKANAAEAYEAVTGKNTLKKDAGKSGSKTIKNVEAPILPEGSSWERNVLNSFAGGKSNSVTYGGGTTLYRVGGKNGGFWSLDPPPATEYQWRVDTAIKQEFCNDASTLYKMTIPEGATLSGLEGKVGSQGMGLYGGAHQVYIDYKAVPSDWIEITPMQWK